MQEWTFDTQAGLLTVQQAPGRGRFTITFPANPPSAADVPRGMCKSLCEVGPLTSHTAHVPL